MRNGDLAAPLDAEKSEFGADVLSAEVEVRTELPEDWHAAVERLAKLPAIEYDRVRAAEAERLHCRVSSLDDEVRRARSEYGNGMAGQALSIPQVVPWPDAVSGSDLMDEVAALFGRFLRLPKHGDTVAVLWVALTYVTGSFDCLPLLFITAPEKGCGKSTLLDLLERICNLVLPASNITSAALYRTVELVHPTLLLDEADSFLRDNEEMRGIIDSGHTRSAAFVIRLVGEAHEPRKFSTWCAKAIAAIGRLPSTIEDRALIVTMQRLALDEHVEKLRRTHQFPEVRRKLARWADDQSGCLREARPVLPEFLRNRTADNWEPLFVIAEAVGGDWPQRVNDAAAAIVGGAQIANSTGTELLRDIKTAFDTVKHNRIFTDHLIQLLTADDSGRWCEYEHGKPITRHKIAKILGRYEIGPGTVRVGAETNKGYKREHFNDAFARYLPVQQSICDSSAVTSSQANSSEGSSAFSIRHTKGNVTEPSSAEDHICS